MNRLNIAAVLALVAVLAACGGGDYPDTDARKDTQPVSCVGVAGLQCQ